MHAHVASFVKTERKRKRKAAKVEARKRSCLGFRGGSFTYDYDDERDSDEDEEEEDPKLFLLRQAERPSIINSTWNFRWRAQERAESEWVDGDSGPASQITFTGLGGAKISGKTTGDYPYSFTGVKVKTGRPAGPKLLAKLAEEWKYLDPNNYRSGWW